MDPISGGRTKWAPAEAQRKRVRWGEEEQWNERVFALPGGNERYGACDDEKQEKSTTLLVRRAVHNCPQCRQFQAFQRAFLLAKNSGRNALLGTSLTVPRTLRQL
ncbi:hypothetical protein B5G37_02940 [Pseudoflavonifractor sp. An85]|nr:hypothetical protein B5G37_02940 [Pseudoflavonifractor sp. An85]